MDNQGNVMDLGIMQGRLSNAVDGRIQSFPWATWKDEFSYAQSLGFSKIEWTLDQEKLFENPFFTPSGQREIKRLSQENSVTVNSVTCDNFMQAPFFREQKGLKADRLAELKSLILSAEKLDVELVILPLVDNSSIQNQNEEEEVVSELCQLMRELVDFKGKVIFESDFPPIKLREFIQKFPKEKFGINYDTGNSASLGYSPEDEFLEYGEYIDNVHIKDRLLGGHTVPLGKGNARFDYIISALKKLNYDQNLILQVARPDNGQDYEWSRKNKEKLAVWWKTIEP